MSTARWSTCCCDTASAEAFFEQAPAVQVRRRARSSPTTIDHHQPYVKRSNGACQQPCTFGAGCIARLGRRPSRSCHVRTRDRLRASRGLKTLCTGQRFLEGFECLRALCGGHIHLADLLPEFSASASPHDHVRTVAAAGLVLGMRLNTNPWYGGGRSPSSSYRQPGAGPANRPPVPSPTRSTTQCRKLAWTAAVLLPTATIMAATLLAIGARRHRTPTLHHPATSQTPTD